MSERYKILLTGSDRNIIKKFFKRNAEKYEMMTTSNMDEDIFIHIKYFSPDILVCCGDEYQTGNISEETLAAIDIPVVRIFGDEESDDELIQTALFQAKKSSEYNGFQPSPALKETRRKHVLLVDDDTNMLRAIKLYLEDTYDVAMAKNGKLALKFLEDKKTDIVLLDYEMPEMNGPEVLSYIRQNEQTRNLPVIFLTGIAEKEKMSLAMAQNPQGYVLKPVEREKLLEIVRLNCE